MTDPAASGRHATRPGVFAAPAISTAGYTAITGTGFLPNHNVIVRVVYSVDDVADYLAFTTDRHGDLVAELPIGPELGVLSVSVSDHRPDPDGECGLLWSNTETLGAHSAR